SDLQEVLAEIRQLRAENARLSAEVDLLGEQRRMEPYSRSNIIAERARNILGRARKRMVVVDSKGNPTDQEATCSLQPHTFVERPRPNWQVLTKIKNPFDRKRLKSEFRKK